MFCYDFPVKITVNHEIEAFLQRCRDNLSDTRLNNFLDRSVTPGNEAYIQQALKKAGSQEFSGPKETWPSLFLSVDAYEQSPYHRNVTGKLQDLSNERFELQTFAGNRLFNLDAVQPDRSRELGDWMKLRALDRDAETLVLTSSETEWMLDMPSEAATNDPYAKKAHGNVLQFGLGIGYVLYMTLLNPAVSHITVIENDPLTIALFREYLMPLFPGHDRFTIIQDDAENRWNSDYLSGFDYIYADIWQSGEDGLFIMSDLLKQAMVPLASADFWIEDSCIVPLRTLIFLHFEESCYHTERTVSPDYQSLMDRVRTWFDSDPSLITSADELRDRMYDRRILRSILGGKTCV